MKKLHTDIETFSEEDLGEVGVYKYAEHPSTRINCVGYRIDDGPVHLWIPFDDVPQAVLDAVQARHPTAILETDTLPTEQFAVAWLTAQKRAHNAQFERVVLDGTAGRRLGFTTRPIEEWVCTAVKAAAYGLPRALKDGAKALGTHLKDEGGRIAMLQLAKPRKPTKADPSTRWTFANAPEKWIAMLCYNIDDVLAEADLDDNVPDLDEKEQRLYWLDQKINQRGWKVDLVAVHNILHVVEEYKAELAAECRKLTEDWKGDGLEPTQREKIADWVRQEGVKNLPNMQAETIKWMIKTDIPQHVKRVLLIYSTYNAKSVSKLQAMLRAVCADGRLRGMFLFYGAGPGRWSSLIVQLQNMMRSAIKDPSTAIEAFAQRDINLIRFLYPDTDPMKVAGSCIRGCLIADDGKDLVFPDYSGVEDRANAWFFDEQWVLDAYRDYDTGNGWHLYVLTASRWFGIPLESQTKKQWEDDPRRQWGKVGRLALGYEGGVSAFVDMVETYGINLDEMAKIVIPLLPEDALDHAEWMHEHHPNGQVSGEVETACNGLKYLWRRDHPRIKQGWKDLKEAAEKAVEFEGQPFWLPNKKLAFRVETYKGRKWLCLRLPSGRKIRYFDPKWTPPRQTEKWLNGELVDWTVPGYMDYMGIDRKTSQWMRTQTYGGRLDQNADEGHCRDMLCNAMLNLDGAGYTIVGSEHDKVVLEVGPEGDVEEIKRLMLVQPAYCAGLPLATDGKRAKRYGK